MNMEFYYLRKLKRLLFHMFYYLPKTHVRLLRNRGKKGRKLEIGAGPQIIPDFERLSLSGMLGVDYVLDAAGKLPFRDGTFQIVYASHVLEHIPWYQTEATLREWVRILEKGGSLEIWVPDAFKICQTLTEFETDGRETIHVDSWYRYNPEKNPYLWISGRMFAYGDGKGSVCDPNWHRALFTKRYLAYLFHKVGLKNVRELSRAEVRGNDHGWINLGAAGEKP